MLKESSPRLAPAIRSWDRFTNSVGTEGPIGIVYHGDPDGVVGAAYMRAALAVSFPDDRIQSYWVATEEYDFEELRNWITQRRPAACAFSDISIENHQATIDFLRENVPGPVFIYDHHVVLGDRLPSNFLLANPTPTKLAAGDTPVPTYQFAHRLASKCGLYFPDWLLLLSMFAEGVDSFFEDEIRTLFQSVFNMSSPRSVRDMYRSSPLPQVTSYLRAEFASPVKRQRALNILTSVATGRLRQFDEFCTSLSQELGAESKRISNAITTLVSEWHERILSPELSAEPIVVIPVDDSHAVAGPVASILRGHFPDRLIVTYTVTAHAAVFEFRTRNDTHLNIPLMLRDIAREVQMINFGGHPSAAGASIRRDLLEKFLSAFTELARKQLTTMP